MPSLDRALASHRAGRLEEAESGYRLALHNDHRNADALHLLGVLHLDRGELAEAEALIRKAISIDERASFLGDLGSVLLDAQRLPEAEAAFHRAIELDPSNAVAYYNLGTVCMMTRRSGEAARAYRRALECRPDLIQARINLGAVLLDMRHFVEAETLLREALAQDPTRAVTYRNLGKLTVAIGRYGEAEASFRRAIELNPTDANAVNGLAASLMMQERAEEAESACRRALVLDPTLVDAQITLASILQKSSRLAEAVGPLRAALERDGEHPLAHYNLGSVFQAQGRVAEAEIALRRAVALDPSHANARWNLSTLLLAEGRYEEGWALHESRRDIRPDGVVIAAPPAVDYPEWGGEPLEGRTLVVISEQGYGDTLQFCRYLLMLKRLGLKRLSVVCPAALVSLMETLDGVDVCIASDHASAIPDHDHWCFMMSLPWLFNTTVETIPAAVPYLRAPDDRLRTWRARLPSNGFKVGLVWAGNPRTGMPSASAIDRRRSLDASSFLPLLRVPGVTFVSLQVGDASRPQIDSIPAEFRPFDPMGDVRDFADTAAIIECLDLVIAVDTSTAHVAGALNRPVWILSRYDACWRWLKGREDSPWYPSVRLFRQQTPGEWRGVIEQVAEGLRRLSSGCV